MKISKKLLGKYTKLNQVLALFIAALLLIPGNAYASNNKKSPKEVGTSPYATSGTWILPSAKSRLPIVVQAGRALPLKFTLADANGQVTTTDMVGVSLAALNSCEVGASIKGTAVVIVPATPLATPSAVASASPSPSSTSSSFGSSESSKDGLKIDKGIFIYVWKVSKTQGSGCYQLIAKKGNVITISPTLKIKSK